MMRVRGEWLLWIVFGISLALTVYSMVTRTQPTQQLMIIEILGLGCGLIAMTRRRSREREQKNNEKK